jgi:hypothetical protein
MSALISTMSNAAKRVGSTIGRNARNQPVASTIGGTSKTSDDEARSAIATIDRVAAFERLAVMAWRARMIASEVSTDKAPAESAIARLVIAA